MMVVVTQTKSPLFAATNDNHSQPPLIASHQLFRCRVVWAVTRPISSVYSTNHNHPRSIHELASSMTTSPIPRVSSPLQDCTPDEVQGKTLGISIDSDLL